MARTHGDYDPQSLHERIRQLYGAETVRRQLIALYREVLERRSDRPAAADVPVP
jgi:hypothetical protein